MAAGVVAFDPTEFKARYPEFNSVGGTRLTMFFVEACLYLSNTSASPVSDLDRRKLLLYMLTAHIGYLNGALSTDGQQLPVGRVSSATQGSVSTALDYTAATPGTGPWFNQSQYGAAFWQATSSLRGMRYISRPTVY